MIKIIYINAGNDNDEAGNANIASFPPLGIISMASMAVERFKGECQAILLDGQLETLKNVKQRIREEHADIVLVSMYCTGIRYSIECVKEAHESGAITVLGNDHAKAHYKTILSKIPEVDLISMDEFGEFFSYFIVDAILNKRSIYEIPNVAYRASNGTIALTKKYAIEIESLWNHPI